VLTRCGLTGALVIAAAIAGCGGGQRSTASSSAAQPLSARAPDERPVRASELVGPIAQYRHWVAARLALTASAADALSARIAAGDLGGARTAWARTSRAYASIGAAYGAFGALDAAINGSPDGLPDGVRDRHFTGLHRIELALWRRSSLRDASDPAARLRTDIARLRSRLPRLQIDPAEYLLRAHEVLEGALHQDVTGHAAPYSGRGIDAIAGEVAGTRVVLRTLRPLLLTRAPGTEQIASGGLRRLERTVAGLRRPGGGFPELGALSRREHERLAGVLGGAAEQLAEVPETLDMRAAAPVRVAPSP
jgi:high-affinity iron transporter